MRALRSLLALSFALTSVQAHAGNYNLNDHVYLKHFCPTDPSQFDENGDLLEREDHGDNIAHVAGFGALAACSVVAPGCVAAAAAAFIVGAIFYELFHPHSAQQWSESTAKETCAIPVYVKMEDGKMWKAICTELIYSANIDARDNSSKDFYPAKAAPYGLEDDFTTWIYKGQKTKRLLAMFQAQHAIRYGGGTTCLTEPSDATRIDQADHLSLREATDLLLANTKKHGTFAHWLVGFKNPFGRKSKWQAVNTASLREPAKAYLEGRKKQEITAYNLKREHPFLYFYYNRRNPNKSYSIGEKNWEALTHMMSSFSLYNKAKNGPNTVLGTLEDLDKWAEQWAR